jgi:hypothetical protein
MNGNEQITLAAISIEFPDIGTAFMRDFFELLKSLGTSQENSIEFTKTNPEYTPTVSLKLTDIRTCRAAFTLSNTRKLTIDISNMTGVHKKSPEKFGYYDLGQVKKRLKGINLTGIDHVGFNLPWFMGGTHPLIEILQTNLKNKSLYHTFPTGEAWDFILPATSDEIYNTVAINYRDIRKPKFELVSFEKSSTPLIQLDVATNGTSTTIKERFPDGLHVNELKQTWVYITNPFELDICLVLNEDNGSDWSEQFALTRLQ